MLPAEKILVIDDDAGLRGQLRTFLEAMGLEVFEAGNGADGLARFWEQVPGLVLLDMILPEGSGVEVCQAIKTLPEARDTAVIVMSGLLGTSMKLSAFHAGAVDYLDKPFQLEELDVRIRTHLRIRRQAVELRQALEGAAAMNRNLLGLNEKLALSDRVKTRFLAFMRNEINNPLADIMGLADRITDPNLGPDQARGLAAMVKAEAARLDRQIHNVFVAAELESGQASPFIARVDVPALVQDVLDTFTGAARAKGLGLCLQVESGAEPFPTDGEKLQHILTNLVANAVEHGAGPGKVVVQATIREGLTVKVVDPGPGLTPAQLETLFEPFHLGSGAFKTERGQRLGLPVARALAEILEGEIGVESQPGQGSSFRVSLPRSASLSAFEAESGAGGVIFFDDPQAF